MRNNNFESLINIIQGQDRMEVSDTLKKLKLLTEKLNALSILDRNEPSRRTAEHAQLVRDIFQDIIEISDIINELLDEEINLEGPLVILKKLNISNEEPEEDKIKKKILKIKKKFLNGKIDAQGVYKKFHKLIKKADGDNEKLLEIIAGILDSIEN